MSHPVDTSPVPASEPTAGSGDASITAPARPEPWTTTEQGPLLIEISRAYQAVWTARAFIRFFVACKNRASVSKTVFQKAWLLAEPLSQMLIYYFLVAIIFGARGIEFEIHPFILIMLGIVHYLAFQQIVFDGMQSVLRNDKLLMQIKVEPLVFTGVSFYRGVRQFLLSLVLYGVFFIWIGPGVDQRAAMYPLILLILLVIAWCLGVLLGSLVVFFRDLDHIMRIAMRLLMYGSPVIYPLTFVPDAIRDWYLLNPIASLFSLLQWSLLNQPFPGALPLVVLGVFVLALFAVSHLAYIRLRTRFTKAF